MSGRVTRDEDGVLRRLTWFERLGAILSPAQRARKAEIRARDVRVEIREPFDPPLTIDRPSEKQT